MSYVWLDVTAIYGWHRPATGILRVESECAAYALMNDELHVRFCRYDTGTRRYVEVMSAEVRAVLQRIRTKPPPPTDANKNWLKVLVQKLINTLPESQRIQAFNFVASRRPAYKAAKGGYRQVRLALKEILNPSGIVKFGKVMPARKSAAAPMHAVPFAAGDIYVSLGLDWIQKDLPYLYSQKRHIGFKVLLFCHDIIAIKFPHLVREDTAAMFGKYIADLACCADKVLCISECTRKDLAQLLTGIGTPTPPTSVVKLGCDIQSSTEAETAPDVAELLDRRFILYVSTIERRKNHETIYRAYTRLIDSGMTDLPLLVFVGMPGWGVDGLLADLRLDPRIQPYIRILNRVTDSDLARLYKHAYFTVFPSLYEGWGLPVAESLAYGKFCLASNAASIPEVGGDLIEYLDPWDVPAWTERLLWYFNHPNEVEKLELAIRTRYQPTAWKETGAAVFEAAKALAVR